MTNVRAAPAIPGKGRAVRRTLPLVALLSLLVGVSRAQLRQDPRCNSFGEFLADGWRATRLAETRPGNSVIMKAEVCRSLFHNLVVSHAGYTGTNEALTLVTASRPWPCTIPCWWPPPTTRRTRPCSGSPASTGPR